MLLCGFSSVLTFVFIIIIIYICVYISAVSAVTGVLLTLSAHSGVLKSYLPFSCSAASFVC